MPNRKWLSIALLPVMGCPLLAEPPAAEDSLHRELAAAERSIDGRFDNISAMTGSKPMPLKGVTRGGYLKGFGAVFTLQVSLVPVSNLSPFLRPTEEDKTQLNLSKRQRVEDLEIRARTVLVEEGARLTRVPVKEKVALIISLFHYSWEDVTGLPSQLVMQARRQVLIDRQAGRIDLPTLKSHLEVTYF